MSQKGTVMAIVNQKGGVGKTMTTENLGIGLSQCGKKVLMVDCDPQASLSIALGNDYPEDLDCTLPQLMEKIIAEKTIEKGEGILHHEEGIDLIPADISLSGLEASLVNTMSRETILKQYLENVKGDYEYVLLDCSPSLGMITINALAAADSVLIPVQPQYLSAKGLEQLLQTINKVKRQINPKLRIDGVLLVKQSGEGAGLLFYGGVILPFADRFPKDLELYRIMTTKLSEIQEAKEEGAAV